MTYSNHFSCCHCWQQMWQFSRPTWFSMHKWTFPKKLQAANLGFSLVSLACFKQSSTEEELWLWVSARNSFMWLFCVIYEWQKKQTEREAFRGGRGSSWVGCYEENTIRFTALRKVWGLWGNRCWNFQGAGTHSQKLETPKPADWCIPTAVALRVQTFDHFSILSFTLSFKQ